MPVPNSFANVTTSIPLSQLDANFNTPITLGNTAIQLGNTVTTLNNMTLANVTVSSGNVTITNVTVTTANVTTANITTAIIGTANVTTANVTTGIIGTANVTTGNITTAIISTANVATANITTSQILNYGTANSVVYLNSSKAATANTGLQFDGTNLGLGVTPSAWKSNYKAVQVGNALSAVGRTDVNTIYLASNWYVNSSDQDVRQNSGFASLYAQADGQHRWYYAASSTAGSTITFTQAMTLDASGNFLLNTTGTPAASAKMKIATTARTGAFFDLTATGGENWIIDSTNTVSSTDVLGIYANGATGLYIQDTGNVGIGTSSPTYRLQVESGSTASGGQAWSHSAGTVYARIGVVNPGVSNDTEFGAVSNNSLRLITNNTERARITEVGELWVARTTDAGAFNIQCGGTGVWGAGAYTNGSDARVKEDIAPITSGLDVVNKLNPVTYRYKENWSKDQSTQTGFIAQELLVAMEGKNYVDGVVQQGGSEGYYSVAYQNIIPLLTKAIQELKAELDATKAEVAALKGAA